MKLQIRCESCMKLLSISDKYCGKKIKCPVCGQAVSVPAATEENVEQEDEWLSADLGKLEAESESEAEDAWGSDFDGFADSEHDPYGGEAAASLPPKSSNRLKAATRSQEAAAPPSHSGVSVSFVSPPNAGVESMTVINAGKMFSKSIEAFLTGCRGKIHSAALTVEVLQSYASLTEQDITSELSIKVYGHVNGHRVDEFLTGNAAVDQRYGVSSARAQTLQARQSVQAGMDRILNEFLETFVKALEPIVPGITQSRGGLLTWVFLFGCLVFAGLLLFFYLYSKQHLRPHIPIPTAGILSLVMAAAVSCSLFFVFVGFASDQSVMSSRLGRAYLSACRVRTAGDTIFIGFGIAAVCWLIPLIVFPFLFNIG